ncbi:MAG: winged helix-turn-helix transcriptional regulator [Clostridium sp.]
MTQKDYEEECPLLLTQRIIGGKWKLSILWFLSREKVMRFTELKKAFDDPMLSQKMLTQHLKELERDNMIIRMSYNTVPPKVEYSLTDLGISFIKVIDCMEDWGKEYMENIYN